MRVEARLRPAVPVVSKPDAQLSRVGKDEVVDKRFLVKDVLTSSSHTSTEIRDASYDERVV